MRFIVQLCLFVSILLTLGVEAKAGLDISEFTIRPGDILQVTVWKEEGMDREMAVLPDGTITFPLAGTIMLQDLTLVAAQNLIKEKLKNTVPAASVTVMVKSPMGHTVSVLGQVVKPGELVMGRRMNVMQALSQAGGLTPYASESGIVVLRDVKGEKTSIEYPYNDIAKGRHFENDVDLVAGDVIFVPDAGLF